MASYFSDQPGTDTVIGTDSAGRAVYALGHRRDDGIWECPTPPRNVPHTPRVERVAPVRIGQGCFRSRIPSRGLW